MILLNSSKCNKKLTIKQKICKYEEEINFSGLKCECECTEFIYHGTYERNAIIIGEEYKINIKRVKCKNCKRTHALIPEFLMPYYQTCAEVIMEALKELVEEEKSTTEVERETNISRQKLNQWRKFYYKIKTTIRETFEKIVKIEELKISKNRVKVYHNISLIFLMQQTT